MALIIHARFKPPRTDPTIRFQGVSLQVDVRASANMGTMQPTHDYIESVRWPLRNAENRSNKAKKSDGTNMTGIVAVHGSPAVV
jgi:hypothetical protein